MEEKMEKKNTEADREEEELLDLEKSPCAKCVWRGACPSTVADKCWISDGKGRAP